VNTATKTALCQIFGGSGQKRKSIAEQTIQRRISAKIVDIDDLKSFIWKIGGELNR
jgi:16S rRNA C1402 N4-methylase RsmH